MCMPKLLSHLIFVYHMIINILMHHIHLHHIKNNVLNVICNCFNFSENKNCKFLLYPEIYKLWCMRQSKYYSFTVTVKTKRIMQDILISCTKHVFFTLSYESIKVHLLV